MAKGAGKVASKVARRALQKQVNEVARRFGLDRRAFGDFIESTKKGLGRGGADNFDFSKLKELAREFRELLGKGTK